MTAHLLIGPVLRRVVGDRATIWVETTEPASVRVEVEDGGAGTADTFSAYGHHYAIVIVEGLVPGAANPYQVLLDGRVVWPQPESPYPASVIRTRPAIDDDHPVRLVFGSCREATPHATARRLPPDALDAYARRLMTAPDDPALRPDLIVLLGDQVYADKPTAKVKRFLHRTRAADHPGPDNEVVSFDEYTKLYLESWRDPEVRWLFATVPTVMIFDDHEIIDDWNTSASWRAEVSEQPWWRERIASGLVSYWLYQHLGNLHPDELATDPLFTKVTAAPDATDLLHEFGLAVDDPSSAENTDQPYRWSYALDVGRTRLVVLDTRCSRVLAPGRRTILPAAEWSWFVDQAHGSYDHLVVGSSLPWLMPPAIHHLEAWNERLADSSRPRAAAFAERLRRLVDLEHWAAFRRSFDALSEVFRRLGEAGPDAPAARIGAGGAYRAPTSISVLSGDVHHSYVAVADMGVPMQTPVLQLTCSPIHNQTPAVMRPIWRAGWSARVARLTRWMADRAGVPRPEVSWQLVSAPTFGNSLGILDTGPDTAMLAITSTDADGNLVDQISIDLTGDDATRPRQETVQSRGPKSR